MSGIMDFLFGGEDTSGQDAARESRAEEIAFLREGQRLGRRDVQALQPGIEQNLDLGAQGALDVFGSSIPAQVSAFQQGNLGAQRALGQGGQQAMNAILGGRPVDLGSIRPVNVQADTSWTQQQLPDFVRSGPALQNAQVVDEIYQNTLGRAPDAAGRAYWQNLLDQGHSVADVTAGIAGSGEGQTAQENLAQQDQQLLGLLQALGVPTDNFGGGRDNTTGGGARNPNTVGASGFGDFFDRVSPVARAALGVTSPLGMATSFARATGLTDTLLDALGLGGQRGGAEGRDFGGATSRGSGGQGLGHGPDRGARGGVGGGMSY